MSRAQVISFAMPEFPDVRVIMPAGALGPVEDEPFLDHMLRRLAISTSKDPNQEWAEKYGTDFENETFMINTACYCDKNDCPWGIVCSCPQSAFHYFADGIEVTFDEWMAFFDREIGPEPKSGDRKAWKIYLRLGTEINKRRTERHDPVCDFCSTGGIAATKGGGAGQNAPNFWY